MIKRQALRASVGEILKREYIALLGQHGSDLQAFIDGLIEKSPVAGMQFISVSLPQGIQSEDEFTELFLQRLMWAVGDARPEKILEAGIKKELGKFTSRTIGFQLRVVLDNLGLKTTANPLVIILESLANAPEEPLRNLLLMLRDYHKHCNTLGTPGKKLRFLAVGDQRLWFLCSYSLSDSLSPFNIAKRVFLDGISCRELVEFDQSRSIAAAMKVHNLTAGVPSLIEKVIGLSETTEDLAPFFEHLEDSWNALPEASKQIMKRLAEGSEQFPPCDLDYACPQIPRLESPLLEAFWRGFLSVQYRELAWRSPIHLAFVMERMQIQGDRSQSVLVKVDFMERATRLEKILTRGPDDDNQQKYLEETLSLTMQAQSILASLLEMVWRGASKTAILQKLHQIAVNSDKGWIKELDEKAATGEEDLAGLLIDKAVWEPRRLLGDFDVFLCHNGDDKPQVKIIAEKLLKQEILPWLDIWELRPGLPWQPLLEQQIGRVKAAAVFVGSNGLGPWQQEELSALLNEFHRRGCVVIPVILFDAPSGMPAPKEDELPLFLRNRTWVNFQQTDPDPINELVWGITGKRKVTP